MTMKSTLGSQPQITINGRKVKLLKISLEFYLNLDGRDQIVRKSVNFVISQNNPENIHVKSIFHTAIIHIFLKETHL